MSMNKEAFKAWLDAMPIDDVRRKIDRLETKLADLRVLDRIYSERRESAGEPSAGESSAGESAAGEPSATEHPVAEQPDGEAGGEAKPDWQQPS
jgi:hypothetical protein